MESKEKQFDPFKDELTQEQAIGILIQGASLAQKAGVYSLEDAELVSKAVRVFKPRKEAEASTPVVNAEVQA